jgi:uncharacterized iron-regulated membrane protein
MRKVLFKLHLIVAIALGAFVVLLGVTGAIMAWEAQLDRVFHSSLSYVKPKGQAKSLAELAAVVQKAYPNQKIQAYRVQADPGLAFQFWVGNFDFAVCVNQYTGEIMGTRTDDLDFLNYVHQLHVRLAMDSRRAFGETTIKTSAVAALFLVVTGAYLWWPVKRVSIGKSDGSRRFWFDLHNSFGIFSFVFILVLIVTGLVIGFDEQTTPLLYRMTKSEPPPQLRLQTTPLPGVEPISPDKALEIARAAAPGATSLLISAASGKNVYRINALYPEDPTPARIAIDPYSGKVLLLIDSRTGPAGYRLVNLNLALHTAAIFGTASKIVMSLASLIMALQLVTGVVMWLKRRKAESRAVSRVTSEAT